MKYSVYIRPLKPEDALISYRWRNDPEIWKFTGSKPAQFTTQELEMELLTKALSNKDQLRFGICLVENDSYVGNISLTDIKDQKAYLHIFIGESRLWGRGIGYDAILHAIDYGFKEINLNAIYGNVFTENIASISMFKKAGFINNVDSISKVDGDNFINLIFSRKMYERNEHTKKISKL